MNGKNQLLEAVEISTPSASFTPNRAHCAPARSLPVAPGGAAPVIAPRRLSADREPQKCRKPECRNRNALSLSQALRIQSAHYWLKLGDADRALKELEALPCRVWNHRLAVKVRKAALQALDNTNTVRA